MQTFATVIGLAAGPALYWWQSGNKNPLIPAKGVSVQTILFILTPFIVISFMPVNSIFIEWNANFIFPEWMSGFEKFAKDAEAQNGEMIKLFTKFDTVGQFVFALFTIAILAGFCEELCFRGMLQPLLIKTFGNVHIAIWTTAIIFSAFHLQFFGFVPRVLLGALFGYLYYWSGSLFVAMLGHMINNGVGVISIYLDQKAVIDFDPESVESVPLPAIIFGAVVFTLLMIYFYRITRQNSKSLLA